jgi:hypothetical protein
MLIEMAITLASIWPFPTVVELFFASTCDLAHIKRCSAGSIDDPLVRAKTAETARHQRNLAPN